MNRLHKFRFLGFDILGLRRSTTRHVHVAQYAQRGLGLGLRRAINLLNVINKVNVMEVLGNVISCTCLFVM